MNKEQGIQMDINIKLTDAEKASIDMTRGRCCLFRFRKSQGLDEEMESEQKSDQVSNSKNR